MRQQTIHRGVPFVMLSLFVTLRNTISLTFFFLLLSMYSFLIVLNKMKVCRSKYYTKKREIELYDVIRQIRDIFTNSCIKRIGSTTLFLFLKYLHHLIEHSTRYIIYLIILQKVFIFIGSASIDPSTIYDSEVLIWNEEDVSFNPTGIIISTSTINVFFSENLNGVCVNKTYSGPNPRLSIGPFSAILETDLSGSELIDDNTLCDKILDQPNPIIEYDVGDISSPLTEYIFQFLLCLITRFTYLFRQTFTWTLTTLLDGYTEKDVVNTIEESMRIWADELLTNFKYIGRYKDANITIGFFAQAYHTTWNKGKMINCTYPFRKNTLAHAHALNHPPSVRGHVHFNALQTWTL